MNEKTTLTTIVDTMKLVVNTEECRVDDETAKHHQEARPTFERSNSWSVRGNRGCDDEGISSRPHSFRTMIPTRPRKSLSVSEHVASAGASSSTTSSAKKSRKAAGAGPNRELLSRSEHTTFRASFVKGAKGISAGTKQVFEKMKDKLKLTTTASSSSRTTEQMKMEVIESCTSLSEDSDNSFDNDDDLCGANIGNLFRRSALSRSLSLGDIDVLGADSDIEEAPSQQQQRGEAHHEPKSEEQRLRRRSSSKSRKAALKASSEHALGRASSKKPDKNFQRKQDGASSKPESHRRVKKEEHQTAPAETNKLPTFEVALKRHEYISPSKAKKTRPRKTKDLLSRSEHGPAKLRHVRRPRPSSLDDSCSWADLTLNSESDSEVELSSHKKNFNPHFSWDLSQISEKKRHFTSAEEKQEEGTEKNDPLVKRAIANVKNRISGSTKKTDTEELCSGLNESTINACHFDDSYQQNFVFESIGSGMSSDTQRENSKNSMDEFAEASFESPIQKPPRSLRRIGSAGRKLERSEVMERQKSPRSRRSPAPSRRSTTTTGGDNTDQLASQAPRTPKTPRSSSARRTRDEGTSSNVNTAQNTNSNGRKPSSWRELYSQCPAGEPSRRLSRCNKPPIRHHSLGGNTSSPTSVQDFILVDSVTNKDTTDRRQEQQQESSSEEFVSPPPVQRRRSKGSRGGLRIPPARHLSLENNAFLPQTITTADRRREEQEFSSDEFISRPPHTSSVPTTRHPRRSASTGLPSTKKGSKPRSSSRML